MDRVFSAQVEPTMPIDSVRFRFQLRAIDVSCALTCGILAMDALIGQLARLRLQDQPETIIVIGHSSLTSNDL
jgi:hypothetical protein